MPTAAEVLCGKAFGSAVPAGSVWGTQSAAALSWAPAGANVPSSARPAASATPPTSAKPIESSKTVVLDVIKAEDQNDGMASVAGALLGLAGSDPVPPRPQAHAGAPIVKRRSVAVRRPLNAEPYWNFSYLSSLRDASCLRYRVCSHALCFARSLACRTSRSSSTAASKPRFPGPQMQRWPGTFRLFPARCQPRVIVVPARTPPLSVCGRLTQRFGIAGVLRRAAVFGSGREGHQERPEPRARTRHRAPQGSLYSAWISAVNSC
jgi:hypothetical protein